MKKILFLAFVAIAWLLPSATSAQTVVQTSGYIAFTAKTNEVFAIYVDGIPYGNVTYSNTQQQIVLSNLPVGVHDITVRLIRPTDRVTHVTIDYQLQSLYCYVYYDALSGLLSILTESNVALPTTVTPATPVTSVTPVTPVTPASTLPVTNEVVVVNPIAHRHIASDADVSGIIDRMKKTSFENDKLQLAQSFVKGKHVSTAQAILIAQSLRMEGKRLDFLLYAYDYCYDRENYYTAIDILNYNSNKQKLLKRIQNSSPRHRSQPNPEHHRR